MRGRKHRGERWIGQVGVLSGLPLPLWGVKEVEVMRKREREREPTTPELRLLLRLVRGVKGKRWKRGDLTVGEVSRLPILHAKVTQARREMREGEEVFL